MTFNIDGLDSLKFTNEIRNRLIKIIDEEKPSIVCFQELSNTNYYKLKSDLDSLFGKSRFSKYDDIYRPFFYTGLPMRNFTRMYYERKIENGQMPVMFADFEVAPNKWVRLFSGHLCSASYSNVRREMGSDSYWIEGIPQYIKKYNEGRFIRIRQADNVRMYIEEALKEEMRVIVAGDMNDFTGSYCLNTIQGNELKDAWCNGGNGFGFTYFGWGLRLRIDHILYSDKLDLVSVEVVDTDLSDHKPLIAKFKLLVE